MARQEQTRRKNLFRLLDLTRRRGPLAQVELARESGLRASTVSYLSRTLKAAGLVIEAGRGTAGPTGGKRSVYLSIAPEFGCYTGALLRGTQLITTIVDFAGNPRGWETRSLEESSPDALYTLFQEVISRHGKSAGSRGSRYLGIGLAVSSVVDETGSVHPSAGFDYDFEELPERLRETAKSAGAEHPTVVIENDANCTALYHHQRTSEARDSIVSLVFSGEPLYVGAGLIFSGALYRGASGGAGEILPADFGGGPEEVDRLVAAAVRLTDPQVVVLALERAEATGVPEQYERLRRELAAREVTQVSNPEASVLGAAYLAYEASLGSYMLNGNKEDREV